MLQCIFENGYFFMIVMRGMLKTLEIKKKQKKRPQ